MVSLAEHEEIKRIGWHSRRGMLELDLILVPFAQHNYPNLDAADRRRYADLLRQEDTDIFRWLLRAEIPRDDDLKRIVQLALAAHAER